MRERRAFRAGLQPAGFVGRGGSGLGGREPECVFPQRLKPVLGGRLRQGEPPKKVRALRECPTHPLRVCMGLGLLLAGVGLHYPGTHKSSVRFRSRSH